MMIANIADVHTFTTRELALPCSYARRAVFTRGKLETRETKSGETMSCCVSGKVAGLEWSVAAVL